MSANIIYLDSSAFIKLFVAEAESLALRRYLRHRIGWRRVSSALLRTEVLRVATRLSGEHIKLARAQLRNISLISIADIVLERAGVLLPGEIRSLDAIHLATALLFVGDNVEVITYDLRMIEAAQANGLAVVVPA